MQDVVGPVCETGDYLAQERDLPPFAAGDLLAVMTAGAYGAVMSSTYNSRLLVPEVLVRWRFCGRKAAPDLRGADRPRPDARLAGLNRHPGGDGAAPSRSVLGLPSWTILQSTRLTITAQ